MPSKYRIVQIGDKFVVQQRYALFFWRGVDVAAPFRYVNWIGRETMLDYCSHPSIEAARKFIETKLTYRVVE